MSLDDMKLQTEKIEKLIFLGIKIEIKETARLNCESKKEELDRLLVKLV